MICQAFVGGTSVVQPIPDQPMDGVALVSGPPRWHLQGVSPCNMACIQFTAGTANDRDEAGLGSTRDKGNLCSLLALLTSFPSLCLLQTLLASRTQGSPRLASPLSKPLDPSRPFTFRYLLTLNRTNTASLGADTIMRLTRHRSVMPLLPSRSMSMGGSAGSPCSRYLLYATPLQFQA